MFGNLINNNQLKHLIENKEIEIGGYDKKNMSLAHYALHIGRVRVRKANGEWATQHDFEDTKNPFSVPANGYVVVITDEVIKLNNENIVGQFDPASTLIEQGFDLVSGKIDKMYGSKKERVVFGLKNMLDEPNEINHKMRVAHVSFYDLRGVSGEKVEISAAEMKLRVQRLLRDMDDGPNYE